MTSRSRRVRPGPIGPDVDLDREDVRLPDDRRLTEQLAADITERALARRPGRPSVTGDAQRTPSLTLRVPLKTREALEAIAAAQGRRLADVSREALAEYIHRHAS